MTASAVVEKQLNDLAQRRDNRRVRAPPFHVMADARVPKCADCNKPSPSFVNLSLGSFVCIECSGHLREFGFRLKGIGLSTFTPAEVGALESLGGNKRCNEVWLCKHPEPDKASPGYEKVEALRRFLVKKYKEKAWYDASAPIKTPPSTTGTIAADSSPGTPLGTPQSSMRKRAESGRGALLASGEPTHRSLLNQTRQMRTASKDPAEGDDDNNNDEEEDSSDDGGDDDEGLDEATKAQRRRQRIRDQIMAFYNVHNPQKADTVDVFVEWVSYHGMAAFNKKLREKYGTDIAISTKNLRTKKMSKERATAKKAERAARPGPSGSIIAQAQRLAQMELADSARSRAGSTNPFDDDNGAATAAAAANASGGPNPFDELRFL